MNGSDRPIEGPPGKYVIVAVCSARCRECAATHRERCWLYVALVVNCRRYGYCIVCRKMADHYCSQTKDPVCSRECKLVRNAANGVCRTVPYTHRC